MSNLFDLSGKIVLITGSSRGLGYALAKGLADSGAHIVLNSRDTEALENAAKSLADHGAKVSALAFDVTSPDSIKSAITYAEDEIGPIDVLINNAGMLDRGPLDTFSNDRFDRLMTTNVSSVFYVSQAIAPYMIARKRGKIINIGSVSATRGRPMNTAYSVSKAAVSSMTYNMAAEWSQHGINVNAIAPGFIAGGVNSENVKNPTFTEWIASRTPIGRWGQPEELVGAAIFLASNASSYVNGHVLAVDGGAATSLL